MPAYGPEPESSGGRRQGALAAAFLVAALTAFYLPESRQQQVAWTLRATVLQPFLAMQDRVAASRMRGRDVDELQLQLDSLAGVLATQSALTDENRTLRSLVGLASRVGPSFRAASVLRPGTSSTESTFFIDLGTDDGVRPGAPVIDRHGLVGVIREVRGGTSMGMDWTHPDFRASAMLADGTATGVVENRRGAFREQDGLVLAGTAYYERVPRGMAVLTSGLGGVFPRGIPIGKIDAVAEVEGRWQKAYRLEPMVQPGAVTHVLVAVGEGAPDVSAAWPADSIVTRDELITLEQVRSDSLAAMADSVRLLRALVEELRRRGATPGGTP